MKKKIASCTFKKATKGQYEHENTSVFFVHLEDTIIKSIMQLSFLLVIFPCYVTAKVS